MQLAAKYQPDRNFKYWIIAPAVFLLLAVGLFPLIYSLVVSFMRIDMMDTDTSFAGSTITSSCSGTCASGSRCCTR